jgi:hypothetical protein
MCDVRFESVISLTGRVPFNTLFTAMSATFEFDPIEDALAAFKAGEFVVVMDDEI